MSIPFAAFSCTVKAIARGVIFFQLILAAVMFAGCTDSTREFINLKGWTRNSDETPIVISGDPAADTEAYLATEEALSQADWKVLEKVAPKPIWERIIDKRSQQLAEQKSTAKKAAGSGKEKSSPDTKKAPPRRDVPIVQQPDGRIQILFQLEHYGGPKVTTVRDGGTDRRKVTVATADLSQLVALVARHLGDKGTAVGLTEKNMIVATCDPSAKDSVLDLLEKIDVPTKQVEIVARIFEVSHDFDFQFGANMLIKHIASDNRQALASNFSPAGFAGAVVNPIAGSVPDPGAALRLIQVMRGAGFTLDATFQALAETGLIKVVASPRITVAAGQTGYILAGQELPIQSATISNDQFVTEKLTYKPIGVQLYITPQTIGPQNVKLHILTLVSAISGFAPLPTLSSNFEISASIVNPILDLREAETVVTINDGDTLVIGGLRMARTITRESKVPGLGDIKFIEWLFKKHRSQKQNNDLFFFVTPHIIR